MESVDLIQPRNIYAKPIAFGHIYMPNSLYSAGARLEAAGVEVRFPR